MTDLAPYTLAISIFLFHVDKNKCDCSEINLLRRCHCKTHRISFFHPTTFFKPMSDNILCISGMPPENISLICVQVASFQLCQCLLLTSFGRAEHGLKLVYYN